MEISFLMSAVRRRIWIVVLFAALGTLPAYLVSSSSTTTFESEAVLLVSPPTEGQSFAVGTGNDRYVENQLSVLSNVGLSERVAAAAGGGLSRKDIEDQVTISRRPGTDLVSIIAADPDPARAQLIADTYVRIYLDDLKERAKEAQAPELASINVTLEDLRAKLEALDQTIAAAVAPYLPTPGQTLAVNEQFPPIPTPDMLVPAAVTERTTLIEEYLRTLEVKTQLDLEAKLRVTSEEVQSASLPTEAAASRPLILLPIGMIAGAVFGILLATLMARWSPKVLAASQVESLVGASVVGTFGHDRRLAREPELALADLSAAHASAVDSVAVLAQAAGRPGVPLSVLVVGPQRGAGVSVLTLALAHRLAAGRSSVLVIDGDTNKPDLTRWLRIPPTASIDALLAEGQRGGRSTKPVPMATAQSGVSAVGVWAKSDRGVIRRESVVPMLEAAVQHADVVLIDGGPMLDLASTLQLCDHVDVVVLAVPLRHQRIDRLRGVRRELQGTRAVLLPMLTHPSSRGGRQQDRRDFVHPVEISEPSIADAAGFAQRH